MSLWAERWKQRKAEARRRKLQRRGGQHVDWWTEPSTAVQDAEPREPFVPTPNPHSWFQFCVERSQAYADRGEPVAAMLYWCLRYIDTEPIGSSEDPCTEAGFEALGDYWEYKQPVIERKSA